MCSLQYYYLDLSCIYSYLLFFPCILFTGIFPIFFDQFYQSLLSIALICSKSQLEHQDYSAVFPLPISCSTSAFFSYLSIFCKSGFSGDFCMSTS